MTTYSALVYTHTQSERKKKKKFVEIIIVKNIFAKNHTFCLEINTIFTHGQKTK